MSIDLLDAMLPRILEGIIDPLLWAQQESPLARCGMLSARRTQLISDKKIYEVYILNTVLDEIES